MDVELLSKMVKELILDNDRVSLPGVGAFVAEMVNSSFSDRGYTINPPYRRLSFRQGKSVGQDTLLVDLYASANNVDRSIATMVITQFVEGMVEELKQRKTIAFPGLGRLRATRENNIFFISDENLDIFPEGFGLEPISLKSHSKPTSFDFSELDAAIAPSGRQSEEEYEVLVAEPVSESEPVVEPIIEPVPEPVPEPMVEPAPEPESVSVSTPRKRRRWWLILLWIVLGLVAAAALTYVVFILLVHNCPELMDRLMYSQEELEILDKYKNLTR